MVNLTIDGKQITTAKTSTIYEAAKENGINIPVLCYAKKLLPYGACRICLVEVEQMKGRLIPSCTTPVTEGMVVNTMSDEIRKVRKTVLEFLLVNHVVECPVCDKGGECDLQDLTYEYEVVTNRFQGEKFDLPTDEINPLIERNMNRCVLCGKCVRVCDEIVGYGSYSFINRGFETKIATAFDRGLNCEFCGQCVSMCPVGAILPRPFKFKARPWQLKEVDSVCGYCGNGCTVTLGVKDNQVQTIRFNEDTGVNHGNLCVRGRFGYSFVNDTKRLKKPMIRNSNGILVEAEWEEALSAAAEGLKAAGSSAGFIAGARLTNEELYLFKKLSRTVGSDNLDHSGGECYRGVTEGLFETLGVKASTGTFPQIESAQAIVAIRSDFYETHPVVGMVVNQAIRRNEAQLTVIADKKGKLTKLPEARTLMHTPGCEINILNALCQTLLAEGIAVTDGVEDVAALQAFLADYTPEAVAQTVGGDAEAIKKTARELAAADKVAILLAYGLPYSAYSKELATAAANLAILSGCAGGAGSGLYLCGEKANSQGAIDLGIVPGAAGRGVQKMLQGAADGEVKALYVVAEDPMVTYPDRQAVEAGLKKPFLVVQDIYLTETARLADVVLPAATFAEKDGTFTNAERRLQRVRAGIKSPGEAQTDFAVFTRMLKKLGQVTAETPTQVFAELSQECTEYKGIAPADIGPQGVVWGGESLAPRKKQLKTVAGLVPMDASYLLLTGSCLYHSGSLSTHARGPLSVVPEAYVELSRSDAATLGVKEDELLKLKAGDQTLQAKVKVGTRLPAGVMFMPYHFAELELNRVYKGQPAIPVKPVK